MDLTVLNLALPALSADLRPSGAEQLWIVDIYGFMVAGLLITMGTLGDRIGRRRLLLIGAAGFGAASVLAAFATSAGMLIAARALLGVAGATLAPSTLSLIRTLFQDPRQRTFADRRLDHQLLGRRGDRPAGRRRAARALLVGLGVPDRRAGDGAAADRSGPRLLPEYRDPAGGRLDLRQRGAVARRRARRGLRRQAGRPGRRRWACVAIAAGASAGRGVRAPPAAARTIRCSTSRCCAGAGSAPSLAREPDRLLRAVRRRPAASPSTCSRCSGCRRGWRALWSLPVGARVHRRRAADAALVRAVTPASAMIGGLLVAAAGFARGRRSPAGSTAVVAGSFVFSLGLAPVFTLAADLIVGARAARARRRRLGAQRDELRARRRARDRAARQPRGRHLRAGDDRRRGGRSGGARGVHHGAARDRPASPRAGRGRGVVLRSPSRRGRSVARSVNVHS